MGWWEDAGAPLPDVCKFYLKGAGRVVGCQMLFQLRAVLEYLGAS